MRYSLNILPSAALGAELCLKASVKKCQEAGVPLKNLVFEVTEPDITANPRN